MKKLTILGLFLFSLTSKASVTPDILLSRSDVIWGFDFLPDGKVVLTERGGKLVTFDQATKKVSEIKGVPAVHAAGQGGLLDVRVHPKTKMIFLTYSEPQDKGKSATVLGTGKIENNQLVQWKKLFTATPSSENDYHYGSRIEFDGEGHIFITSGERGERPLVQELSNHLGKIIRLNEDGSVPQDNPYVKDSKAKPEIWAKGVRSPQGLAFRPGTKELWEAEMGPKGGDEINLIAPTKNYGWPVVTYGREYDGPKIGEGTIRPGVQNPMVYWVPSISPSALAFYNGDKMPEWKGNVFLATLSGEHLRRLELKGSEVVKQEELFKDKGWRFRNVRTGPDGYLWFSTDEGKLGRILPLKK